jgi:agmatine/peptidylarginine deiminase
VENSIELGIFTHNKLSMMKQKYFSLVTLLILFTVFTGYAQIDGPLPKGLTEQEKNLISEFQFTKNSITPPPTGPVRTMAEWEEVEYLVITWQPNFQNILRQIVAVGVAEAKVMIVTQNEASVSSYLQSNGIDLTNVTFLDEPWDSIWIRDYAGNTIYSEDTGERALVDWIYNRPRPNDDVIPVAHANELGIPYYATDSGTNDLVNTGGNFMSDGLGNAFASKLILDENEPGNPYGVSPKTEAEIDAIMMEYMGIENYIKMETLPYDAIHHIDMHMKLLDEETLLVSKYPDGVADGPQIEANIEYVLSNFQSAFGTPYDVEWMPAPPSVNGNYPDTGGSYRTYTNAVFINKSVIVPTYRPEVDGPALAQWQELLPGYNIVGIDVDNPGENLISLFGAIHCITHTIGVAEPLWIVHQPIDEAAPGSTVDIQAMIKHESAIASADIYYREVGTTSWGTVAMQPLGSDQWEAQLPIAANGEDVEYYIQAQANSGKTMVRPIVAPEGYWTINVDVLSVANASRVVSGPIPNPADETVSFTLQGYNGNLKTTVYSVLGEKLFENSQQVQNGKLLFNLNPTWNGMLFFTFEGEFGTVTKKVLKR